MLARHGVELSTGAWQSESPCLRSRLENMRLSRRGYGLRSTTEEPAESAGSPQNRIKDRKSGRSKQVLLVWRERKIRVHLVMGFRLRGISVWASIAGSSGRHILALW